MLAAIFYVNFVFDTELCVCMCVDAQVSAFSSGLVKRISHSSIHLLPHRLVFLLLFCVYEKIIHCVRTKSVLSDW